MGRYQCAGDDDGWTVIDTATGEPASLFDELLVGLSETRARAALHALEGSGPARERAYRSVTIRSRFH